MKNKPTSKNTKSPNRKERRKKLQISEQIMTKKHRSGFSMTIGLLSFLFGLIAFLFLVYPRFSVEPGESLDLYKPFETPFVLKNDGYWSLVDINYNLTIDKMEDINQNKFTHFGIRGIANKIPKLRPNEASTIFINRVLSAPPNYIKYVELYINVTYKPFLIPITFTVSKRFKTNRKSNGEYVWFKFFSEK